MLPYITEDNRQPLMSYLNALGYDSNQLNIVLSHNDIKGVQLGRIQSTVGFDKEEIEKSCNLFINGHLHNGVWVTKKALNLGNLTGLNFGENAFKYEHRVLLLDTDTRSLDFVENPYSLRFYQIDILTKEDLDQLDKLGSNSVVTFKYKEDLYTDLLERIKNTPNIIESRCCLLRDENDVVVQVDRVEDFSIDHLQKFKEFVLANIGNDPVVQEELSCLGIQSEAE